MIGPASPFNFHGVGNDVVPRTAGDLTEGQDRRIQWIYPTADDGLGRGQELSCRNDGIYPFMRHGGVTGLAFHDDANVIRCSHHRPRQDANSTAGQGRPDVEAVDGVDAVESPGRNQPLSTADR